MSNERDYAPRFDGVLGPSSATGLPAVRTLSDEVGPHDRSAPTA